ncbi:OmpA family protein [Lysobacter humi (ex Lee et al. 2017)]
MPPSFAQLRKTLLVTVLASTLAACASLPPPTGELAAAEQSVSRAATADAEQYAAAEFAAARSALSRAQAAMSAGDEDEARRLALLAAADADLAHARSRVASASAMQAQRRAEVVELQQRLGMDADAGVAVPAPPVSVAGNHAARLQALAADPRLGGLAAVERLQAQQAVAAVAVAKSRQRPEAEALAERRVLAAEAAAYAQAVERDAERLEREARDLQLEATRREAAEARAEAERLRLEARRREEEAERMRQAALAEEQARQQAEQAATAQQAAKVGAARDRELALAREEAELVTGAKLPPAKRAAGSEVYTLAGDAFASGQASLTSGATGSLKALAAYLAIARPAGIRIEGHTDSQGDPAANQALSQRRADAVRQALVAAGVDRSLVEAAGRGAAAPIADNGSAAGRAKNRRVEISVSLM